MKIRKRTLGIIGIVLFVLVVAVLIWYFAMFRRPVPPHLAGLKSGLGGSCRNDDDCIYSQKTSPKGFCYRDKKCYRECEPGEVRVGYDCRPRA